MLLRIAIVGFGSIGKRHNANLKAQGHKTIPLDIEDPLRFDCDCAFICSPTQCHTEHALEYLERGIPVFIEKPLTYNTRDLYRIIETARFTNTPTMVGCNLRFHPQIRKAKEIADNNKVIFARAEAGSYLPGWRKSDYRESYSASEYGGILLDAIHEPDYLYWLFGNFKKIRSVCDKVSDLDIKNEDIAEIGIIFHNGVSASVHCDYLMPYYHRKLDLYLSDRCESFKIEPTNQMYADEAAYFISCLEMGIKPMNSVEEAGYVLKKVIESRGDNTGTPHVDPSSA